MQNKLGFGFQKVFFNCLHGLRVFAQGAHSALGMSAVLARAAESTHEIVDARTRF